MNSPDKCFFGSPLRAWLRFYTAIIKIRPLAKLKFCRLTLQTAAFIGAPNIRHFSSRGEPSPCGLGWGSTPCGCLCLLSPMRRTGSPKGSPHFFNLGFYCAPCNVAFFIKRGTFALRLGWGSTRLNAVLPPCTPLVGLEKWVKIGRFLTFKKFDSNKKWQFWGHALPLQKKTYLTNISMTEFAVINDYGFVKVFGLFAYQKSLLSSYNIIFIYIYFSYIWLKWQKEIYRVIY